MVKDQPSASDHGSTLNPSVNYNSGSHSKGLTIGMDYPWTVCSGPNFLACWYFWVTSLPWVSSVALPNTLVRSQAPINSQASEKVVQTLTQCSLWYLHLSPVSREANQQQSGPPASGRDIFIHLTISPVASSQKWKYLLRGCNKLSHRRGGYNLYLARNYN